MGVTTSKKAKKDVAQNKTIVVSKKVRSFADDPFVVKKAKAAESFLKKHGLPKVASSK